MSVSLLRALALALGVSALAGSALPALAQPANAKPPLDSRTGPTTSAAVAQDAANRARRQPGDHIAVVVNAEVVTAGEIAGRVERARQESQSRGERFDEAAAKKAAEEALIEERVLVTHARESGAKVEESELDRVVANVAAQNRITVPFLLERLKQDGTDVKRFRENLRDQLLIERVRDNEVARRIRVTDGEIDKLLEERRAAAQNAAPVNLAQILIPVPANASAEQRETRRREAEAALKRVLAGEDFATVAREVSQDSNRANGGEIGLRPAERLPEVFQQALQGLAVGQVRNQLVESSVGFHAIKLLAREEPPPANQSIETRARHILLRPNDRLTPQLIAQRLGEAKRAIEAGRSKFEDIARQISEDGTREQGGDLGWAAPGNFVPEFEETMNALPIGGISDPFQSRFGIHIVQVMERRTVTIEARQLREQARSQVRERKFDDAYKEWIADLRAKAFIEVREAPL